MFCQLPKENPELVPTDCSTKIGEGAYGIVFRCATKSQFVVKCDKDVSDEDGISYASLREWVICSTNRHYNIPRAIRVDMDKSRAVYPHYGENIRGLQLTKNEKISITQQFIRAIAYAHCSLGVMNRDIKTDNILYNRDKGRCVVIDWGIGRHCSEEANVSGQMYTLWYRPPEVLLGSKQYGFPADVWAVGMILVELWLGENIEGDSNIGQLYGYFRLWGTPNPSDWPSITTYNGWRSSFPQWKETWSSREDVRTMKRQDPLVIDLIESCLHYDPEKRIKSRDLLHHPLLRNQLSSHIFVFPSLECRAASIPPLKDIMKGQEDLTWEMRTILYEWLEEVQVYRNFSCRALFIAYQICDKVLAKVPYHRKKLQLLGITCFMLSSKMNDQYCLFPPECVRLAGRLFTNQECIDEEKKVLEAVNMDLIDATPLLFIPKNEMKDVIPVLKKFACSNKYTSYTSHCIAMASRLIKDKVEEVSNPWTSVADIYKCANEMDSNRSWELNPMMVDVPDKPPLLDMITI